MTIPRTVPFSIALSLLVALVWFLMAPAPAADAGAVIQVPKDAATINGAIGLANPGDTIKVSKGPYTENVLIANTSDIRLLGSNTLLQGSGIGAGITVLNSTNILVQGFVVDGYEIGVVLEGTSDSRVHNVETRNNDSAVGSLRDGLLLRNSHNNTITNVNAHHNGHNGISLRDASTNNLIQASTASDNGLNPAVAINVGGCGIQLIGAGHSGNSLIANLTERNGWGIQIGRGSNSNDVRQNRSHENKRAGIVTLDNGVVAATDNFIGQNNAKGNGLSNIPPSLDFDLFDQLAEDNTWRNNQGTFNH